ncbi:MAG: biotin/lipoate A/B protein ligase family protein [Gemmatimonadaceae bacterium]
MALDEALMHRATETGAWILRVYGWSAPTLSLGRNQTARGAYDLELLAARGIDVVRRPTGGRAILHDREITYSVAAPLAEAGDLRESYARINRLLIAALRALGVDASVVAEEKRDTSRLNANIEVDSPGLLPCFHHPSMGEIVFEGRKLIGSAQWRSDAALLQHGSILIDDDQMQLSSLLVDKGPEIPPAATLRDALGVAPSASRVADALFNAVRTLEDASACTLVTDAALDERANRLRAQYLDATWTWRR